LSTPLRDLCLGPRHQATGVDELGQERWLGGHRPGGAARDDDALPEVDLDLRLVRDRASRLGVLDHRQPEVDAVAEEDPCERLADDCLYATATQRKLRVLPRGTHAAVAAGDDDVARPDPPRDRLVVGLEQVLAQALRISHVEVSTGDHDVSVDVVADPDRPADDPSSCAHRCAVVAMTARGSVSSPVSAAAPATYAFAR
jgi:hypothetical protein